MGRFNGTLAAGAAPAAGGRFGGTRVAAPVEVPDTPPEDAKPGSKEYADWALARVKAGKTVPQVSQHSEDFIRSPMGKFNAAYTSAVEAIPIAGPKLLEGAQAMRAAIQGMTPEEVEKEQAIYREANPVSSTVGSVTGTVAPFIAAASIAPVATILGFNATLPTAVNMGIGAASQAAISTADALVRGGDSEDATNAAMFGAAGGAMGPLVGKAAEWTGKNVVAPAWRAATGSIAPTALAERTLANVARPDVMAGRGLSATDEAVAAANGQTLINADRLGPAAQDLARVAANRDTLAKAKLAEVTQDRFLTQNTRAADWVRRNTGAPTDVHAVQQTLSNASKGVNNAAYRTAYSQPAAQAVWTPEIEQLMQSETFRSAVKAAIRTSNEEAAINGTKPLKSPFVFHREGTKRAPHFVSMTEGEERFKWSWDRSPKTGMAAVKFGDNVYVAKTHQEAMKKAIAAEGDGVRAQLNANPDAHLGYQVMDAPMEPFSWVKGGAEPTLEFWDHVQRALRRRASQLGRSGEFDFDAGQVSRLRTQLNDVLDEAVPEFKTARGGAARWFGAEDALEAGQNFSTAKLSDIPEAAAAHAKFSAADKKLFASGFASALIDKIGQVKDPINVINTIFKSPQARAQIELAMGPKAAAELEAFIRIEDIMNATKLAVSGGSNTAAQLVSLGALGAIGGGITGSGSFNPLNWNPAHIATGAGLMAMGRMGAKAIGEGVDQKVMQEVARLLSSNDSNLIRKAVENASRSSKSAAALKAIQQGLSMVTRAAPAGAASESAQTEQVE